jgi:hypothetical protein
MAHHKYPSSYRLSEECRRLIERLSDALGISQAGVLEQAVRKLARAELPDLGTPASAEAPKPRRGRSKKAT